MITKTSTNFSQELALSIMFDIPLKLPHSELALNVWCHNKYKSYNVDTILRCILLLFGDGIVLANWESKLYLRDENRLGIDNLIRSLSDYWFWKIGLIRTASR